MKILVTFAVDDEFAPWLKLRPFERVQYERVEAYRSSVNGLDVLVILTGVGGKKAWVEATEFIWNLDDIDMCLASGLAGALRPEHRVGEIIVPRRVGAPSWSRSVESDREMFNLAVQCGAKPVQNLYSADRVIITSSEKKKLGELADAVDMESGDVLFEAAAFGARITTIRAISDSVDEDLPVDFNRVVTENGDVSIPSVLGQIARHPASLPALIRFGRQSRAAAEKLATFLDHYLECLADANVATTTKESAAI